MIARYFTIDTERAPLAAPITKANYRFRFVGSKGTVSVFQITPRRKRKGMIAGELWIDNETGLVTHLAGRLVKNPSILLRKVEISQEMELRAGSTFARETHLLIDTRFAGPGELTIRETTRAAEVEVTGVEVTEHVTP
jgi:hypothetical protein